MAKNIHSSSDDEEIRVDLDQFIDIQTRKSKRRRVDVDVDKPVDLNQAFLNPPESKYLILEQQNPGLEHILRRIFLNLSHKDQMSSQLVNKTFHMPFKNALFLLKTWKQRGLSDANFAEWNNALTMSNNTIIEKDVYLYLKRIFDIGHTVDVPCFINGNTLQTYQDTCMPDFDITSFRLEDAFVQRNYGMMQILAARVFCCAKHIFHIARWSQYPPIMWAVEIGIIEVVQALAPLIKKPNAIVNFRGRSITPIYLAAESNYTDIIKFLTSMTDKPNDAMINEWTPIHAASLMGHVDVVKLLAPLTTMPNAPNGTRRAPIFLARRFNTASHNEIVQILQSYDFA